VLIDSIELTLGHVGLGNLGEVPLLTLFASAQAHRLTMATGHTLRDVTDVDGSHLYPGYLWLHLRVPPSRRLDSFRLWDRVAVGVDVRRYGRMILDSTYVLGADAELPPDAAAWNLDALPSMRAASVWVIDGPGDPQPSAPKQDAIADLPVLKAAPEAVARVRVIRAAGGFGREPRRWSTRAPIAYPLRSGRDVARDHNLMFATYVEIMEVAAATLLGEEAWPALPAALLDHRVLLEREVFFLSHTGPGKQVLVDVRADLSPCAQDLHGAAGDQVSAGILDLVCELYEAGSNTLLAVARARELFLVPRSRATLITDLARFMP
jgi:probable biosynthetic protein (TIGR04098 family)